MISNSVAPQTSQEQDKIRGIVRAFVQREVSRQVAREFDAQDAYPHELLRKLGETGLLGVTIPQEYGGMGGNVLDVMPIYEELSRALPVLAWVTGNIMLYGNDIISTSGNREQKEKYLPMLAKGRLKFSFALTEPNAGSDAANISTKAVYHEGYYWITGSKMFITGAGVSDVVVTMARTGPSKHKGITAFLVDTRSEGYSARPLEKLGYHGSNTCSVYYDNVKVLATDILGGEEGLNQGWFQMVKLLNSERLALSACALGIGRAALDDAVAYTKERFRLGPARGRCQAIQHALVDMATELEAARRLAFHAGWLETQGLECVKETSMSKYFATETAKKIVVQGINILGRNGSTLEFDMQRYLRDVLVLCIGGGTTQIQKNIVAQTMGL
ncbi:MAG TPA: acyl-CoA dehydrogenase [Chloroflexi bacterium]|nr:acyl-CoA dehydrogenase [Chloroflexota bacterium]